MLLRQTAVYSHGTQVSPLKKRWYNRRGGGGEEEGKEGRETKERKDERKSFPSNEKSLTSRLAFFFFIFFLPRPSLSFALTTFFSFFRHSTNQLTE
jgi:hypothetical protein